MSPRLIVAILDGRTVPFTPGMIGRLSTATGAPVATIKKAWQLKDSGHDVVRRRCGKLIFRRSRRRRSRQHWRDKHGSYCAILLSSTPVDAALSQCIANIA